MTIIDLLRGDWLCFFFPHAFIPDVMMIRGALAAAPAFYYSTLASTFSHAAFVAFVRFVARAQ